MAIHKLWYVVPLNQEYAIAEMGNNQARPQGGEPEWLEPVQARNPLRANARGIPAQANQVSKYKLDPKKCIKEAFATEEAAVAEARELATKNPKEPYAVLGILGVYETVPADPIKKQFSEAGELVVSAGE